MTNVDVPGAESKRPRHRLGLVLNTGARQTQVRLVLRRRSPARPGGARRTAGRGLHATGTATRRRFVPMDDPDEGMIRSAIRQALQATGHTARQSQLVTPLASHSWVGSAEPSRGNSDGKSTLQPYRLATSQLPWSSLSPSPLPYTTKSWRPADSARCEPHFVTSNAVALEDRAQHKSPAARVAHVGHRLRPGQAVLGRRPPAPLSLALRTRTREIFNRGNVHSRARPPTCNRESASPMAAWTGGDPRPLPLPAP